MKNLFYNILKSGVEIPIIYSITEEISDLFLKLLVAIIIVLFNTFIIPLIKLFFKKLREKSDNLFNKELEEIEKKVNDLVEKKKNEIIKNINNEEEEE